MATHTNLRRQMNIKSNAFSNSNFEKNINLCDELYEFIVLTNDKLNHDVGHKKNIKINTYLNNYD